VREEPRWLASGRGERALMAAITVRCLPAAALALGLKQSETGPQLSRGNLDSTTRRLGEGRCRHHLAALSARPALTSEILVGPSMPGAHTR
jgi:hypothetical protein